MFCKSYDCKFTLNICYITFRDVSNSFHDAKSKVFDTYRKKDYGILLYFCGSLNQYTCNSMMRKTIVTILITFLMPLVAVAQYGTLSDLHVDGKNLKDAHGNIVVLHGVMDTPSPYFNGYRWGSSSTDENVSSCLSYFEKLFTAITDTAQGAYCDVFRLHLDPCWTNTPGSSVTGESDISAFSADRLSKYMKSLYYPLVSEARGHGLYVVVRPPGVCPASLSVGDAYQKYLLTVWNIVSKNDSIRKYAGSISLELANEPVKVYDAEGEETATALHDYFQPIADTIRANGFTGIIWVPGSGWQGNYKSYASNPVTGYNIGYAVHDYPGWYDSSDDSPNIDGITESFKTLVPVVETNPVIITEVDWSPEKTDGSGHYNEHGVWVPANLGTWATATTSKWGVAYKKLIDYYGNISMTLSGTGCYIDIDKYISSKTVTPAFDGNEEACAAACFKWYKQYAADNVIRQQETLSRADSAVVDIAADKTVINVMPATANLVNISATTVTGKTIDVTSKCRVVSSNPDIAFYNGVRIVACSVGNCVFTYEYTDVSGNVFTAKVNICVSMFPLTEDCFNPSIYATGTFDEATGALTTGQYGFGGWEYPSGIDLSGYKYLVVDLKQTSSAGVSFRLFDANSYWGSPSMTDFGNDTHKVIDLTNLKTNAGNALNTSHIYIAGFWSLGNTPFYIKDIYLSNDGENPTGIDNLSSDQTPVKTEYYLLDGRKLTGEPQTGVVIEKHIMKDGTHKTIKKVK